MKEASKTQVIDHTHQLAIAKYRYIPYGTVCMQKHVLVDYRKAKLCFLQCTIRVFNAFESGHISNDVKM